MVGGRRPLLSEICAQSEPPPSKNADFDRFSFITSQFRNSKKVQLPRIESRPRASQRAIDGVRTLTLSPQWVTQKVIFVF